jgi:tripartite-type tricarboxylate transporter receptor subunit TctC
MNTLRKIAAGAALALNLLTAGAADAFPSRPVTIIVPYSAGGPIDR